MKVLYICHRTPFPPDKGEKIRAFHQLKALSAKHDVDLFTLSDQRATRADLDALAQYCRRVTVRRIHPATRRLRALSGILSQSPLTLPYFYSGELKQRIREAILLRGYDRIFVYCSAMAQYVDWVRDIPILTDLVDIDSDKWSQYATFTPLPMSAVYKTEGERLREYERRICRRSEFVIVTTAREAALGREISPGAAIEVIPNGVDTEYFKPQGYPGERDEPVIVFTGDMSYFPNEAAVVSFVGRVFPWVRRQIPDAQFTIVGRNPTDKVKRLGSVSGVKVTGAVPDVRPWLDKAKVAVAPFTIAAGIQNKVLEALAYGRPVVATRKVLQGLSGPVAKVIRSGESPEELASAVVELLRNTGMAQNLGAEGRRQVTTEYSWSRSAEQLLSLVERRRARTRISPLVPRREPRVEGELLSPSCPNDSSGEVFGAR